MKRPISTAARTLAAATLVAAFSVSCPNPIDDELLQVVDDAIAPVIIITSPEQFSTYRYSLSVNGTLLDSSQEAGDGRGFVRTLTFAVPKDPMLDRTITFERDGSWIVDPPDPTFSYTPGTGAFTFTVSTVTLTYAQFLLFTATDLNGNETEQDVTVMDENAGPDIALNDAAHPCPTLYSSAATTKITMRGWIDPAHYQSSTAYYKVVPAIGLPRSEVPFTPEADGEFTFEFYPRDAPALAGKLTVWVYAKDEADRTTQVSHEIFDDPGDPTGSFSVAAGAAWTNNPDTTLVFAVTDGISGMNQMRFKNESAPGGADPWSPYAGGSLPWTLQATDGTRTVYAQFSDQAGNIITLNDTIVLDTIPPSVTTFRIEGGNAYTPGTAVTLSMSVSDGSGTGMNQMQFSDDGISWSGWQAYAPSRAWTLPGPDGLDTVYARFTDQAGNQQSSSDTITLDRSIPTIDTFTINGGAAWTGSDVVTLTLGASDATTGPWQMRIRNDGDTWDAGDWVGYATSPSWTLRDLDGDTRTVYVQVRDYAGNESTVESQSIGLDRTNPSITTFKIHDPDGTAYTDSLDVTLEIAATDAPVGPYQMQFSNDNGATWSAWEDYATSRPWRLAEGAGGTRSVDIQVNDRAGNVKQTDDGILYNPP